MAGQGWPGSEHLAWSQRGAVYHPDLLPFPRTLEALDRIVANVSRAQEALKRTILIENPSLYLPLNGHELEEVEFLAQLARRTGCGLLVDVNNIYVSANNLGFSAKAYLDAIPAAAIGEIHLAGHAPDETVGASLLIDTHGQSIAEPVWSLYADLLARTGPKPTLIERDDNIPSFAALMAERDIACDVMADMRGASAPMAAHG